jgi:lysine 6-dehydrogenase
LPGLLILSLKGDIMKILLLGGAGLMGPAIAKDLIMSADVTQVIVGDIVTDKLEQLKKEADTDKLVTEVIDVQDEDSLISYMKKEGIDVVINSLPHEFSVPSIKTCIKAGKDVVDLAYEPPQHTLDDSAKDAGVTVVPACGMDPGITNILTGYGVRTLDQAEKVHIIAGGIPQSPYPPLQHRILFRLESLWMEYLEPSLAIRNGEKVELETLSEVETVDFPGVGTLECAVTPTLASMPYTIQGVQDMVCKCPRWPGHYEKIKAFIQCKLLSEDPIKVENTEVIPRKFLSELLSPVMELKEDEKDVTVIRVTVSGEKDGKKTILTFDIVDRYDETEGITSVARTTGYPASIVAQMIGNRDLSEPGVLFPENAITQELFPLFAQELKNRDIIIKKTMNIVYEL